MLQRQVLENLGFAASTGQLWGVTGELAGQLRKMNAFNDPKNLYALCGPCESSSGLR